MSTTLDRVHALFGQRGINLQFGSSLSAGKGLSSRLNYTSYTSEHWMDKKFRFGLWDAVLRDFGWNKVALRLYGSNLHDDPVAIPALVDLAKQKSPQAEISIYSAWPRRTPIKAESDTTKEVKNIDYGAAWQATYTATAEDTGWKAGENYASRDYMNKLIAGVEAKFPGLSPRLIPVGEVLFATDKKTKEGALPGLKELAARRPDTVPGLDADTSFQDGVNVLYADPIHLNPMPHKAATVGNFISGTTLFTALGGQSPVELSGKTYDLHDTTDAKLTKTIHETIRDVVTSDPRTGIGKNP